MCRAPRPGWPGPSTDATLPRRALDQPRAPTPSLRLNRQRDASSGVHAPAGHCPRTPRLALGFPCRSHTLRKAVRPNTYCVCTSVPSLRSEECRTRLRQSLRRFNRVCTLLTVKHVHGHRASSRRQAAGDAVDLARHNSTVGSPPGSPGAPARGLPDHVEH